MLIYILLMVLMKIFQYKHVEIMKKNNVVTLPIASDGILKGLVTIGDISRSYFEVYDSNILSVAKTRFENIVDTLKAKVVTGDTTQIVDSGKVVIAAANPRLNGTIYQ